MRAQPRPLAGWRPRPGPCHAAANAAGGSRLVSEQRSHRRGPVALAGDVAIGVFFVALGLFEPMTASLPSQLSIGRLVLCLLHVVVGTLFVVRRPLRERARFVELLVGVPPLLIGGIATGLAGPTHTWPLGAEYVFSLGGLGAAASLATLGRCFAILPGARGVVSRGPYAIIRHPAYFCETIMLIGAAWALGIPAGAALLGLGLVALVLRIVFEERPLLRLPEYRVYAARVRYRLLPGLW